MINFKNFKQVKYTTFIGTPDSEKIGYMWLVRDESNGMSYIYFGSRKYAEINDVSESNKLSQIFTTLGNAINENGEWVGFTGSTDVISNAQNISEAISSLDTALGTKTEEINNAINEIKAQISGVFHFKGIVDTVEKLNEVIDPQNGDVYRVGDSEYVYNGEEWVELGTPFNIAENTAFIELSEKMTTAENSITEIKETTIPGINTEITNIKNDVNDIKNSMDVLFIIDGNDTEELPENKPK